MLDLKHIPHKHTYKYIQSMIVQCFNTWDIDLEKPAFFTTDNGRNIAKAINTYSNWTRIPCFGHCLQLAIKCSLKNFPQYEALKQKCRSVATFFSKSTTSREKFINFQKSINPNVTPLNLVQEVNTRWNSTYFMFERFITLHTTLNVMLYEENTPDNLSTDEWIFFKSVITILEPLKDATEIMSGERYPTISQYFPMYYALMNVLQVEMEENTIIVDISNKVRNALKERFEPIEQDPLYICATVWDPRYKDQLLSVEQKQIMYRKLNEEIAMNREPTSDKDQDPSGERKSKLLSFLNNTLGNTERHEETFNSRKDREIAMYLTESIISRFPLLSAVVKRFLAIPATQITSEQLFSTSGNIVTNTRARLLPENVEQICFLHNNLK